ncbi:hypothetical protein EDD36DRAFT_439972, partial [Exophiala viscosa]
MPAFSSQLGEAVMGGEGVHTALILPHSSHSFATVSLAGQKRRAIARRLIHRRRPALSMKREATALIQPRRLTLGPIEMRWPLDSQAMPMGISFKTIPYRRRHRWEEYTTAAAAAAATLNIPPLTRVKHTPLPESSRSAKHSWCLEQEEQRRSIYRWLTENNEPCCVLHIGTKKRRGSYTALIPPLEECCYSGLSLEVFRPFERGGYPTRLWSRVPQSDCRKQSAGQQIRHRRSSRDRL